MREIKFRVWFSFMKSMDMDPVMDGWINDEFEFMEAEGRFPMQYTGLKDKNGREIFEGDVIKWGEGEEGEVRWIGLNAAFNVMMFSGGWLLFVPPVCEVIGNIYENPELVKEG